MFTRDQLAADLRRMGARLGDTLIVHSSFRSIGGVEGGPATVVEVLKSVVGPMGLLAMPTFTFGRFELFSVADSPSQTGAVTEVFRLSEGVRRSAHPTHAMALWGNGADELAQAHLKAAGLDVGSPYHLASERPGARILLVGVGGTVNSYIHVCEAILDLPYVGETFWHGRQYSYDVAYLDGRRECRLNIRTPGCSKGFGVVDRELERREQLHRDHLGAAVCMVLRPPEVLEAVRSLIQARPSALLCPDPQCGFCPAARKALQRHAVQRRF